MLSWIGEQGPEAVIPLTRTPRALGLLRQTSEALGAGGAAIGPFHIEIHVSGAGAEVGEHVQMASVRLQDELQRMLEDLLRRHRREEFA
jgi:hypothetical protein